MQSFFALRAQPKKMPEQPAYPPPARASGSKREEEEEEEPPRGHDAKRRKAEERLSGVVPQFVDKFAECVVVEPREHIHPTDIHYTLAGRYIKIGTLSGTPVYKQDRYSGSLLSPIHLSTCQDSNVLSLQLSHGMTTCMSTDRRSVHLVGHVHLNTSSVVE